MFASMSHEFRSPINVILNYLRVMITHKVVRENPALLKGVKIASTSCKFLLSLVNDTLDYTQIKGGKLKLLYSKINIREFLSEVAELFSSSLSLRPDVKFELIVASRVKSDSFIYTDIDRVKQVLVNLLRNSQKFTFKGLI